MSRSSQRFERVTVNLVPENPVARFSVPTTFDATERMYGWKQAGAVEYMIIPTRVTRAGITLDLFVHPQGKGKGRATEAQRLAEELVKSKVSSEWKGLRLAGIERASAAAPPSRMIKRGTIEEILGTNLDF